MSLKDLRQEYLTWQHRRKTLKELPENLLEALTDNNLQTREARLQSLLQTTMYLTEPNYDSNTQRAFGRFSAVFASAKSTVQSMEASLTCYIRTEYANELRRERNANASVPHSKTTKRKKEKIKVKHHSTNRKSTA